MPSASAETPRRSVETGNQQAVPDRLLVLCESSPQPVNRGEARLQPIPILVAHVPNL